MVKRVSVYTLPKGVDPDAFWKYHTEVHAVDITQAAGQRLKKYVLNRVIKVEKGEPKFFGLIELWFENEEVLIDTFADLRTQKAASGKSIVDDFQSRVIEYFAATVEEKEIV
jgi:uncharacterized protein (TIGR02118 family)